MSHEPIIASSAAASFISSARRATLTRRAPFLLSIAAGALALQALASGQAQAEQRHEQEEERGHQSAQSSSPPPAQREAPQAPEPPALHLHPAPQQHDYRALPNGAPPTNNATQYYTQQYSDEAEPQYGYTCLIVEGDGYCSVRGPAGIGSGAPCYCRYGGSIQNGPLSGSPPYVYVCNIVNIKESCTVRGPAGVAPGADCYCEFPGQIR